MMNVTIYALIFVEIKRVLVVAPQMIVKALAILTVLSRAKMITVICHVMMAVMVVVVVIYFLNPKIIIYFIKDLNMYLGEFYE